MEIKDYFRDSHPKLSVKFQCLLHILLKCCHVAINRGAIKWNIGFMAAAVVKGIASRAHSARLPGFLQFVGDAMQPANHGAVRIQDATRVNVKGAHQSNGAPIVTGLFDSMHNFSGPQFYPVLHFGIEGHQPLFEIIILNEGMMVKPRAAAIVLTPIAGKSVMGGRPIVGIVHGSIDTLQLWHKSGQYRRFNKIYFKGAAHC